MIDQLSQWLWPGLLLAALALLTRLFWHRGQRVWWWWSARRTQRLDDAAVWHPYDLIDPETGEQLIGIELITPDHRMIDDNELYRLRRGETAQRRQQAFDEAFDRAVAANVDRTPANVKMWRQRQEALDAEDYWAAEQEEEA